MTDQIDAYGIAQFTVDPGTTPGGTTTMTLRYYHAPAAPTSSSSFGGYSLLETITFSRPRSDGSQPVRQPPAATPQFADPALVVAATAAVAAGGLYVAAKHRTVDKAHVQAEGAAGSRAN